MAILPSLVTCQSEELEFQAVLSLLNLPKAKFERRLQPVEKAIPSVQLDNIFTSSIAWPRRGLSLARSSSTHR